MRSMSVSLLPSCPSFSLHPSSLPFSSSRPLVAGFACLPEISMTNSRPRGTPPQLSLGRYRVSHFETYSEKHSEVYTYEQKIVIVQTSRYRCKICILFESYVLDIICSNGDMMIFKIYKRVKNENKIFLFVLQLFLLID